MRRLVILATGASINDLDFDKVKQHDTLAWGNSFMYFASKGEFPNFWWFMDPHASLNGLGYIGSIKKKIRTRILIPKPILTESHKKQIEYIGKAGHGRQFNWHKDYHKYLRLIRNAGKYATIVNIEATSYRRKYYDKYMSENDDQKWLKPKKFITYLDNKKFCILNTYGVGRLTSFILPCLYYLISNKMCNYKELLFGGFDGKNMRFDRTFYYDKEQLKNSWLCKEYKMYMPMWKGVFRALGVELYKITESPMGVPFKEI